jgi:hypothetical protein
MSAQNKNYRFETLQLHAGQHRIKKQIPRGSNLSNFIIDFDDTERLRIYSD